MHTCSRLKLTLPLVPSMNHCYRNVKINLRILMPKGREWFQKAGAEAQMAVRRQGWKVPDPEEKVILEYNTFWPDARRRDVHNQEKLLMDGLEGIVYQDDKMVLPRAIDFEIDRLNPRLEVVVYRKAEECPANA